ncbi:NADP-dependent oxidoreductase [Agromyces atrinae]|uniref:NADP-dependent oxidoreductase n=1 Tax=Agromyces atrinae TaxID=592376 RepID=UPI001F569257|nr:NADP-dependent oxidoreductase [Agromyces atrinae]MCI2959371.1 NADP-dependent oxidoreductase [Agromyces atrinae]
MRFTRHGGPDVLELVEIPDPVAGMGEVVIDVIATGLNPIESTVREGRFGGHDDFASGQGRDIAGIVSAVGDGVTEFRVGDEVFGFVRSGAQALRVAVPVTQLLKKPPRLGWENAGSLYVAGTTAWTVVRSLNLQPGDVVVITAAAGGLGCLAAQLAVRAGATVIGTAAPLRADFLRQFGITPLAYDDDLEARVGEIAPGGASAFLDFLGGGGVETAIALGIEPKRIVTVLDREAADEYGVALVGAGDLEALSHVAKLVTDRQIVFPIADIFPLERVAEAYRALDRREAPGKIVLGTRLVSYSGEKAHPDDLKQQDATLGVPTDHERIDVHENLPPVIGDKRYRPVGG